ncbi:hypothetical protein ACFWF7_21635 [Nocardia sp. NPDC060256]|uniref:hypothetical protein n=1 Tax=unclassified Nocardia TaxID=2637762 RepID=UPI003657C2A2
MESAFELSYRQLTADQARAFRLLAVADSADFSLEAAGAMLHIGNVEAEDLLESLVDASLLDSRVFGRYYYHDVTRAFAHLRLREDEAQCTLRRLLDFYLATACTAFHLAVPGDPEIAAHALGGWTMARWQRLFREELRYTYGTATSCRIMRVGTREYGLATLGMSPGLPRSRCRGGPRPSRYRSNGSIRPPSGKGFALVRTCQNT